MKKVGGTIIRVIVILIILMLSLGIYFYNFYVFKTVRVCIGEPKNIMVPCEVKVDCVNKILKDVSIDVSGASDYIKDNFKDIVNEVVYCNNTCFVKDVRGLNLGSEDFELLGPCNAEEKEFAIDIRGKDLLWVWRSLQNT